MYLDLKRQEIVRMHKTCLTSQFLWRSHWPDFPAKWRVYPPKYVNLYFSKILEFSVVSKRNNTDLSNVVKKSLFLYVDIFVCKFMYIVRTD